MDRAGHRARDVGKIALTLTGAILWLKDDNEPIRVMEKECKTKNVLWGRIGGQRYAFSEVNCGGVPA